MDNKIIQELINDRAIAYRALLAKAFDSVSLAILWEQLRYWTDRTKDPEGWIYKSSSDIFNETALTRKVQETARERGRELGILEEKIDGFPATVHFRVNMDRACIVVGEWIEKNGAPKKIFRKEKTTNSIEWLKNIPPEEMKEICIKFNVSERFVMSRAEDIIDYCSAKGKKYSDYKAALRNFIKSHKGPKEEYDNKDRKKQPWEDQKQTTPAEQEEISKKIREIKDNFHVKSIPR